MNKQKRYPIDRIVTPIQRFIQYEKSGSLVLGLSVIIALFLANSPLAEHYFSLFHHKFGFQFNGNTYLEYDLLHWINDGLMAIFFFVVGLELKKEFVGGELANPRKAILPIGAAVGGMLVPALVYFIFNPSGDVTSGWGIPMATDIAFALGVLSLLGNRVPLSLKVFLMASAIVDDLGAILVIALFYPSGDISVSSLIIGLSFVLVMFVGNKMGVRSVIFYAIFGILGVWTAFLLSGVHATIASVLAAFTIPADVRLKENVYIEKIQNYLTRFKNIDPKDEISTLTEEQHHILEHIKEDTNEATPPLQRLDYIMSPISTFIVLPIFALANAGVSFAGIDLTQLFSTNISFGVGFGLLFGKAIGITLITMLLIKLKVSPFPEGMTFKNLLGIGFLGGIGFTMALFVTSLAFNNQLYTDQAKIGLFIASILSGVVGYMILSKSCKKDYKKKKA